jgi:hypothetical protein
MRPFGKQSKLVSWSVELRSLAVANIWYHIPTVITTDAPYDDHESSSASAGPDTLDNFYDLQSPDEVEQRRDGVDTPKASKKKKTPKAGVPFVLSNTDDESIFTAYDLWEDAMVGLERQVLYEAHNPTKHQGMIKCWRTLVDRFGKVGLNAAAEMALSQRRECLVVVDLCVQTGSRNCRFDGRVYQCVCSKAEEEEIQPKEPPRQTHGALVQTTCGVQANQAPRGG